jgi:leucyl aminopeptidase
MVRISVESRDLLDVETPLLAIGVVEGQPLLGVARRVDEALHGLLTRLNDSGEISGKTGTATVLHSPVLGGGSAGPRAERILVIGYGPQEDLGLEVVRRAAAVAANRARELKVGAFALAQLPLEPAGLGGAQIAQAMAEGIHLALYRYRRFKSEETAEDNHEVEQAVLIVDTADESAYAAGAHDGELLAAATITARDLATGPANLVTATYLGDEATDLARRHGFSARIFGKSDLEEMGCGGLLAVNQGSTQPPAMGVLRYDCGINGAKTLAAVGKGIVFDTGGISIKPANNMHYMRHDKSGAAAVIGFLQAAATLKLPINVLGVFAATDNMPGGNAYRPGDVIKSYSGKYMEIHNTDAEGRVVLADALAYAVEQKPDAIVDLATLTGACVVALGHVCSGLFSNDDDLAHGLLSAGDVAGERLWRMPLWKEYREQIKAPLGDFKNVGGSAAGSITAAWFLANFVGDVPWAHLDIAGTAWTESSWPSIPAYMQRDVATGVGVLLLTHFARAWA